MDTSDMDQSEYYHFDTNNSRFEPYNRNHRNSIVSNISKISGVKHLRNDMQEITDELKELGINEK